MFSFMNMYIVKKNCMVSPPRMQQCPNCNVFVKLPNIEFRENPRFFMWTDRQTWWSLLEHFVANTAKIIILEYINISRHNFSLLLILWLMLLSVVVVLRLEYSWLSAFLMNLLLSCYHIYHAGNLHSHFGVSPDHSPCTVHSCVASPRKMWPTSQWYSIVEWTLKSYPTT
jgi:hypothetical protein